MTYPTNETCAWSIYYMYPLWAIYKVTTFCPFFLSLHYVIIEVYCKHSRTIFPPLLVMFPLILWHMKFYLFKDMFDFQLGSPKSTFRN